MFYINPKYEPPIQTPTQLSKKVQFIQSLLLIPKYSRTNLNNKQIYEYFIKNYHLIQIQREKSLRARILCVIEIELITEKQYIETTFQEKSKLEDKKDLNTYDLNHQVFLILQKFYHDSTLAVLRTQTKQKIMNQNQDHIKRQIVQLRKFSMLKLFFYHQLLYLSHFVQKTQQVSYKQFLYQQGDKAECAYYIQEGEFQVFKNLQFQEQKLIQNFKNNKEISLLAKNFENQESPHKQKATKIEKIQLYKIEGSSGQCFGQTQFFLSMQKRAYSLKCNSLNSSVFRIPFKNLQQIFNFNTLYYQKLKEEYKLRFQNDLQKICQIKRIKQRISPKNKFFESSPEEELNRKLVSRMFEINKSDISGNMNLERAFTLPSNSLTIPSNQLGKNRSIYRKNKLFSQNARKIKIPKYEHKIVPERVANNINQIVQVKRPTFDSPFFPLINKNQPKHHQSPQNHSLTILKNKKYDKIKGLVDITTIVEEKQLYYNSMSEMPNPEFSFYKIDEKTKKKLNYQKSRLQGIMKKAKRSPAHSQRFMNEYVSNSLNKFRFLKQKIQGRYEYITDLGSLRQNKKTSKSCISSFPVIEDKRGQQVMQYGQSRLNLGKLSMRGQNEIGLVNNQLDIYFDKI